MTSGHNLEIYLQMLRERKMVSVWKKNLKNHTLGMYYEEMPESFPNPWTWPHTCLFSLPIYLLFSQFAVCEAVCVRVCVWNVIGRHNTRKICPGEEPRHDTFHSSPDQGLFCSFSLRLKWALTYTDWKHWCWVCGEHVHSPRLNSIRISKCETCNPTSKKAEIEKNIKLLRDFYI